MNAAADEPLLQVRDLAVEFDTYGGIVHAVRDLSFIVEAGSTLAIVGESGCGKSVSVQSLMRLIPMPPGRVTQGQAIFKGVDLLRLSVASLNQIRGREIGMIFQDPMSSLNPTMKVGRQISETLVVHQNVSRSEARAKAVGLLDMCHIPEAVKRAEQYPFEYSGGMLQRAMIAMALACKPSILIADEPTTALDVTIQAQVLELMLELQRQEGMAIILITHDLGVVARMADYVAVMYAGQIIESGSVDDIFYRSAHPYTLGLKQAMPSNDPNRGQVLKPIDGSPPDLFHPPIGCGYFARCPYAARVCEGHMPPPFSVGEESQRPHAASCWLHHKEAPKVADLCQPHQAVAPEAD